MDIPHAFQYLDLYGCWPTDNPELLRVLSLISAKGRQPPPTLAEAAASRDTPSEGTLTPHGVLQVCLLCTLPFARCAARQICDMRHEGSHTPRVITCPGRVQLIDAMGDVLLRYEQHMQQAARDRRGRRATHQDILSDLDNDIRVYNYSFRPRGRWPPSVEPSARFDRKDLSHLRTELSRFYDALDHTHLAPRVEMLPSPAERMRILQGISMAFLRYLYGLKFPHSAIYTAMFAILQQLHLEEPAKTLEAGARRIEQFLRRNDQLG